MNNEYFKMLFREKRRELQSASQGSSDSFGDGAELSEMLDLLQDAYHRLNNGSYGKCTLCGSPIELSRMEAVLWTTYCLKDQEEQDRKAGCIDSGVLAGVPGIEEAVRTTRT